MHSLRGIIEYAGFKIRSNPALVILLFCYSLACCASLIEVGRRQPFMSFYTEQVWPAVIIVSAFTAVAFLFVSARFSFGYFVGFYLYTMLLGFLWLQSFTEFHYAFKLAGLSAFVSGVVFLLPALLIDAPFARQFPLSNAGFVRLLSLIMVFAVITVATASSYSFKLVSLTHIYDFRNELHFPVWLRYSIGIVSTALLPFAFACYWALNQRWKAGATLLLMTLFYPITLSKFAFFAPVWILTMLALSKVVQLRTTVILSLLLPMFIGSILILAFPMAPLPHLYFDTVNIRMFATPSNAMVVYNDFFTSHPLTHFCQISFLKPLMQCAYQDPISVVMDKNYAMGALNASLFATEGIASVGPLFAPLTAAIGGLVIAVGNRASAGLPTRFVLVSGSLLPQIFLNVPLTTTLLTYGAAVLFLLWYVMPRDIFASQQKASQ